MNVNAYFVNLVGLLTTIIVYYVQSPNQSFTFNLLVLSPLLFLLIFNISYYFYKLIFQNFNSLSSLSIYLKQYRKYLCDSYLTYRILNNNGDAIYFCLNKIKINGNHYIMNKSVGEYVYSKDKLDNYPPEPKIIYSNVNDLKMKVLKIEEPDVLIDGVHHYTYAWKYEFLPPLRKNDIVHYEFKVEMPKAEIEAFRTVGTPLFLDCKQDSTKIDYTMIAPDGYMFNILKQYVETLSKARKPMSESDRAILSTNKQIFHWKPRYSSDLKYVSIYQLCRI